MDQEPDAVLVTSTPDGITTITINRPNRRNAVDPATAQKLYTAVRAFEDDASQKVLILNGNNGTFCAGFDLHSLATSKTAEESQAGNVPVVENARTIGPMGPSRLQISKPVISAVSGYAVAGGLELSLLGDIRVAEEDAVFGVFCRRWGVPLIDGGTVRLQAIVGLGRAMDMILTGRPVGAQEALAMGLANRVVAKGKALEEAEVIARQLLTFPQECMNLDRTSAYYACYSAKTFDDALKYEFDHGVEVVVKESIKGAARFSGGMGRHGAFQAPAPVEGKL
ncbi:hypothetical protein H072_11258 [Dactylellina haptotyla CBS 200.50]|uniref:Enoyl-CoA hydratase n=1 Tax=Dactylellina haptotyla (strain CBS 200.50) TaxID=1284197 RepID=S8B8Q2_DACHA|nr:hypothetical protein H072_11258 [Dactylellina haptotyla CBS 200.50]